MIAETVLWHAMRGARPVRCAVIPGCGGVDLLVVEGETITRRERHPDRSTAYERARALRREFEPADGQG
ncbi:MAG: hypothetical protein ABI818_11360 [Acidobacteriota bacterium]